MLGFYVKTLNFKGNYVNFLFAFLWISYYNKT